MADSISLTALAMLAGTWQAEADSGRGSPDRREALRGCADMLRMLCEARFEDCPHAAPHRYCAECPVKPCPIGLGQNILKPPYVVGTPGTKPQGDGNG